VALLCGQCGEPVDTTKSDLCVRCCLKNVAPPTPEQMEALVEEGKAAAKEISERYRKMRHAARDCSECERLRAKLASTEAELAAYKSAHDALLDEAVKTGEELMDLTYRLVAVETERDMFRDGYRTAAEKGRALADAFHRNSVDEADGGCGPCNLTLAGLRRFGHNTDCPLVVFDVAYQSVKDPNFASDEEDL
jgi:hypothetical protein